MCSATLMISAQVEVRSLFVCSSPGSGRAPSVFCFLSSSCVAAVLSSSQVSMWQIAYTPHNAFLGKKLQLAGATIDSIIDIGNDS